MTFLGYLKAIAPNFLGPGAAYVAGTYALGSAFNNLTGGTSSLNVVDAFVGPPVVWSDATLALSAYDPGARTPDGQLGGWQLPIFNKHTVDAITPDLPDWALPAAVLAGVALLGGRRR